MRAAGVPTLPGTDGRRRPSAGARSRRRDRLPGDAQGVAGGGGRGMRLVDEPRGARGCLRGGLRRGRRRVRRPARSTSRRCSSRRAMSRSRCSATTHGNVLTLGERECSIQRRHQKLDRGDRPRRLSTPELREEMESAAERACRVGRLRERRHLRVPARPGRGVLVHRAERAAAGRASGHRAPHRDRPRRAGSSRSPPASASRSTGRAPRRGHAIEIRLNAEDPARDFMPAPGDGHAVPAPARPGNPGRHLRRGRGRRSRPTTTR